MSSLDVIRTNTLRLMRELGEQHLGEALQERGWTMEWDRAKRRMGACITRRHRRPVRVISLSKPHARHSGWGVMEDVARHEVAHALDHEMRGRSDHGPIWKAWAIKCGADPSRIYEGDESTALPAKYAAICPNTCGYEVGFHRMVKRWYLCPDCTRQEEGGARAFLHIVEKASGRIVRLGGTAGTIGNLRNSGVRANGSPSRDRRNLKDPKDYG